MGLKNGLLGTIEMIGSICTKNGRDRQTTPTRRIKGETCWAGDLLESGRVEKID
jgi:hypothetical protein